MRIGIDARMLDHSGIGSYTQHLLDGFGRDPGPHEFVVFTGPHLVERVPVSPRLRVVETKVGVYALAEHGPWRRALASAGCDLIHVPHYNVPLGLGVPYVVTVHDLIHWRFPRFMRSPLHAGFARLLLRNAVHGAARILVDSAHIRADLERRLGLPPARMTVVHLGVDPRFRPLGAPCVEEFRRARGLPARFLLYVGLRRPHKNLTRLVRAFAALQERHPSDLGLVLWGRPDARDRTTDAAVEASGCRSQIVRTHAPLADAEMPLLYNAAAGVVLPSLDEGFGLPALEAMACGIPLLASRAGALPEVAGGAALLVDPYDEGDLARGLARLAHDAPLRSELARRGLQRASEFDWERTARAVRAVYEATAGQGRASESEPGVAGARSRRRSSRTEASGTMPNASTPPT